MEEKEKAEDEDIVEVESNSIENTPPPTKRQRFFGYIWDSYNKPPAQRKALIKLDLSLLALATCSTFMKYLDKSNLTNAYVSGMEEDLSLYGNEMSNATVAYSVASIVVGFPAAMILAQTNAKWFIITIEVIWTIITYCMSAITNRTQMIALRAVVGALETPHFPALMFIFGSWYTKEEIARRTVIFQSATAIGPMFSGYLQSAAYNGLNGTGGRAGWRWLFIIDGIFSTGIIVLMVLFFPNVLAKSKPSIVFSEAELKFLRDRKPLESRKAVQKYTVKRVVGYLIRPETYLWWMLGIASTIAGFPSSSMSYYLLGWSKRDPGSYSVAQRDNYPTVINAIQFLVAVISGWSSDTFLKGRRWPPILLGSAVQFIVDLLLGVLNVWKFRPFRFFLYCNTAWGLAVSGMYWSWIQERFEGDAAERSFMSGGLEMVCFICDLVFNLTLWKTTKQPAVKIGNIVSAVFAIVYFATAASLAYIWHIRRLHSNQIAGKE